MISCAQWWRRSDFRSRKIKEVKDGVSAVRTVNSALVAADRPGSGRTLGIMLKVASYCTSHSESRHPRQSRTFKKVCCEHSFIRHGLYAMLKMHIRLSSHYQEYYQQTFKPSISNAGNFQDTFLSTLPPPCQRTTTQQITLANGEIVRGD
jgi:hypothetical protein